MVFHGHTKKLVIHFSCKTHKIHKNKNKSPIFYVWMRSFLEGCWALPDKGEEVDGDGSRDLLTEHDRTPAGQAAEKVVDGCRNTRESSTLL